MAVPPSTHPHRIAPPASAAAAATTACASPPAMSADNNIYSSSASSLDSDGRKRKEVVLHHAHGAATATTPYKRFRRDCSLLFGSSRRSPSGAAGSHSRSADLDSSSGPDAATATSCGCSCVEDAPPTPRHSGCCACACAWSSELRSEEASWDAGSSASFLDSSSASGWGSNRSSSMAATTASTEVTSSELQESEASFHPVPSVVGESTAKMARARAGSHATSGAHPLSSSSSKRRKFQVLSTSLDDSWLDCGATTPRRHDKGRRRLEVDHPPPATLTKAASVEVVKVAAAACSQDDQTAPAPVYVLSSGRKSRPPEDPGKRPPTVDDEFDQYFAQLML